MAVGEPVRRGKYGFLFSFLFGFFFLKDPGKSRMNRLIGKEFFYLIFMVRDLQMIGMLRPPCFACFLPAS